MAVSESDRREIYTQLEGTIGLDAANNLMSLLPYQPADELVTRTDLHALTTRLHGDMSELRAELRTEMAELRTELKGEMAELRTELKGDMAELRTELKGDMAELRTELKGDMANLETTLVSQFEQRFSELRATTNRNVTASMAGNTIAVITALVV